MNLRKFFYSSLSILTISIWAVIAITFAIRYGAALDRLPLVDKMNLAKYGIGICIFMFHFTWACGTLGQIPLAFAMSDQIGNGYIKLLKSKYRLSLLFSFVDIGYFIFFVVKFWGII